jgi:hypothetical protein
MKVKNIMENAAEILGVGDLTRDDENRKILFRCANLVAANIASNYLDCKAVQTFTVTDNKINFSQFNKTFLKVKSVKTGGNEVSSYELFIDFLKVPNGIVEVTFACVPAFADAEDDHKIAGNYNENVLLYGILAEYAFINGMLNEAKVWNEKFEQLLFGAGKKGTAKIMPVR